MNPEQRDINDLRANLLRGVYEDNVRTVKNLPPPARERTVVYVQSHRRVLAGSVLGAVLLLVVLRFVLPDATGGRLADASMVPINLFSMSMPLVGSVPIDSEDTTTAYRPVMLGTTEVPLAGLFNLQVRTIVIDPGHGGIDPGAVGKSGLRESDVTLDVALRLKRRLEGLGRYRVLMTRTTDTQISLMDRVAFSDASKADLFISIHVNYLGSEPITSIETYYFGTEVDRSTMQLAEKENRGSEYSVGEFEETIRKIGSTIKQEESKRLAVSIQKSLYRNMRRINQEVVDWGVKTAPFVVLLGVKSPSVLAEIACLSNRAEEQKLGTPAHRERLAASLEEGIIHYLAEQPTLSDSTNTQSYAAQEIKSPG